MLAMLVSLVLVLVGVVVGLLALGAFTVLPVFLTVERAEQRGLDPDVWAAIAVLCAVAGLAATAVLPGHGFLAPLLVAYVAVVAVNLTSAPSRAPGKHR